MTLIEYRDLNSPESWLGWTFGLSGGRDGPVALPPTVRFGGDLGLDDPYEYDHAPFDDTWYKVGDGIQPTRPLLLLTGQHTYRSDAEALDHAAEIERALLTATALHWRGQRLTGLNTAFTHVLKTSTGETFADTTFALTLNTLTRVTRRTLAEAIK